MESKLSISVVIPNYNGKHLLEANIPSIIKALHKAKLDHEIIVSDDASTDDSVPFLKKHYPEIIVLESEINLGFSPTINRGIFRATKTLVFALNSDVVLMEDYFLPQLKYFKDEDTFGVMGRIIGLDNNEIQDGAKYPLLQNFKIKSTINFIPVKESSSPIPTLFLSGANALMVRTRILELKGFDEVFKPFYLEDVDLSIRAWRLGWKCYYEHQAVCRHPASTTIKSYNKEVYIKTISVKNRLSMHSIHLEGFYRLGWVTLSFFELMFSWVFFRIYFYKGFYLFLKEIKAVNKSRKRFRDLLKKHNRSEDVITTLKKMKKNINQMNIKKF